MVARVYTTVLHTGPRLAICGDVRLGSVGGTPSITIKDGPEVGLGTRKWAPHSRKTQKRPLLIFRAIEQVEAHHLLTWGDRSECTILETEGTARGSFCQLKKGQRMGYLLTLGAAWTEPGEATVSMARSLQVLEAWTPTQLPKQ